LRAFCDKGEGSFKLRTSVIFGAKKYGFFEIYGISTRTRGEGVGPVRNFLRTRGINFLRFRVDVLYGRPLFCDCSGATRSLSRDGSTEKLHGGYDHIAFCNGTCTVHCRHVGVGSRGGGGMSPSWSFIHATSFFSLPPPPRKRHNSAIFAISSENPVFLHQKVRTSTSELPPCPHCSIQPHSGRTNSTGNLCGTTPTTDSWLYYQIPLRDGGTNKLQGDPAEEKSGRAKNILPE